MANSEKPHSLADTWLLSNRVNLQLLDALSDEQLAVTPAPRARTIADQFAHLHNVRMMWLEPEDLASAKSLKKIAYGGATKTDLKKALEASAKVMAELFANAEKSGKVKGSKRGPLAFLGYLIAHEAHHRGQILAYLKQAGMPVDKTLAFALWEWDKI